MTKQVSAERIELAILLIRGHRVLLDADLALLYGVSVGRLNEAVKRNRHRFPGDFMFQLSEAEFHNLKAQANNLNLKSQFAISSSDWGGRRHPPYAFTEQGVAMLSAVAAVSGGQGDKVNGRQQEDRSSSAFRLAHHAVPC